MDKKRRERFESLIGLAQARLQKRPLVAFDNATGIQPGDRFLMPDGPDAQMSWVAILPNKDDSELWYIVAADQFSLVGTADVVVEGGDDAAQLVLRCGHGLWAKKTDLSPELYLGRIGEDFVDHAKEKLQSMVQGQLVGTADAELTDDDPAYLEWEEEISSIVEAIEHRIQRPKVSLSFRNADPDWKKHVKYDYAADHTSMAASSGEGFGMVAESPDHPAIVINDVLPGSVVVLRDYAEILLQYFPLSDESPENVALVNGQNFECDWGDKPIQGPYLLSNRIPLSERGVEITFESGKTILIEN